MQTSVQGRAPAGRVARTVQAGPYVPGASQAWTTGLSLLVSMLALVATTSGIFTGFGHAHRLFLSLRGETISLQGGGLYANDSVSAAAQAIGQDVVTLLIAMPLLLLATYLAAHGSLRGKILRAGALWYFAYTYLLMAFGAAYNPFFLIYVALFSASLVAFVLALLSIDAARLPSQFSPRLARRPIAWLLMIFGGLLALMWLGRIAPSLTSGTAPVGLDAYSTLFVQAGDLGLVVPLAVLSGALLLRKHPVGYLLTGVMLVKGAAFGLALGGMLVAMAAAGTGAAAFEVAFFVTVTVVFGVAGVHYLACLPAKAVGGDPGTTCIGDGDRRPVVGWRSTL